METAGELKRERVRRGLQALAQGRPRPGDALPGGRRLEEQPGVSRITVRGANPDLVREVVLVRIEGKKTFVSHGRVRSGLNLASSNEDTRTADAGPSTRAATAATAVAPGPAAELPGLAPEDPAHRLRRLRLANGAPVSVDESWLPPRLVPELLLKALTGFLYGTPAAAVERSVSTYRSDRSQLSMRLIRP